MIYNSDQPVLICEPQDLYVVYEIMLDHAWLKLRIIMYSLRTRLVYGIDQADIFRLLLQCGKRDKALPSQYPYQIYPVYLSGKSCLPLLGMPHANHA